MKSDSNISHNNYRTHNYLINSNVSLPAPIPQVAQSDYYLKSIVWGNIRKNNNQKISIHAPYYNQPLSSMPSLGGIDGRPGLKKYDDAYLEAIYYFNNSQDLRWLGLQLDKWVNYVNTSLPGNCFYYEGMSVCEYPKASISLSYQHRGESVDWVGLANSYQTLYDTFSKLIGKTSITINESYADSYSMKAIKSVIIHELGHALGLEDLPKGWGNHSIMSYEANPNIVHEFTELDLKNLKFLYS